MGVTTGLSTALRPIMGNALKMPAKTLLSQEFGFSALQVKKLHARVTIQRVTVSERVIIANTDGLSGTASSSVIWSVSPLAKL
jgi:hypothetical protein